MSLDNITFQNGSLFDDNPFSDAADEDEYEYRPMERYMIYIHTMFEILKFLISLASFVSDIYFIVVMSKFKNLRNRINNLILLYMVLNIMYLALANLIMILVEVSTHGGGFHFYCIIANLDHLLVTLGFYTLTFLAVDWYVLNYHPDFYSRFPRTFKYGLGIFLVVLAIPKWLTTSIMCFDESRWLVHNVRFGLESLSFTLCGVILICLAILRRFRTPLTDIHKSEYAFSIPAILFLLSFATYLTRLIVIIVVGQAYYSPYTAYWNYLYFLEYLGEGVFLAQPIIVLYLLGRQNKHFKMAYLKCCKRNVQQYDDEDLDTDSINESPQNNVSFHKSSEVIRF